MFEWKPPDPRLVAMVRRLREAVHRRFPTKPANADSEAIDDKRASERESTYR
jgi:hypothetical protein